MKISAYLQMIEKEGRALCYHALRGNLFLLEPEYLAFMKSIGIRRNLSLRELRSKITHDLIEASYITEDEDEREYLFFRNREWMKKVIGGGQLHLLNLMISEACNFGCEHCLHKCSIQTGLTHGQKKIMNWEIAKKAIDEYAAVLKRQDKRNLNVHFGSAEPLLNWPVLQKSVTYIRFLDPDARLAVNTNLSLLTAEMAAFLRDNRVYISTSLDGPAIGNDAIRVFKDGSGTFDAIVAKFKILADVGYPLDGFSITINDLNFDSINADFIAWAHQQGFRGIATDIDLINTKNSKHSVDDCINKLMELRRICHGYEMENFGTWTTAYDNLVNEPDDNMPTFCKAIKGRNISINPSGKIFICGHTNTSLGSLDEFNKIFEADSPYVKLVESRLPGNDPMCFGCEIEGVCAGQCQITREVASVTGNGRDSLLCRFYRSVTRKLLEEKLNTELLDDKK